jgi:phage repressor protein C with HTH and peptisase S24 domain
VELAAKIIGNFLFCKFFYGNFLTISLFFVTSMSTILERIKEYIDIKGITIAAFERSIGMSNASFGKSLKNKGAIGTDKLENILSVYPDISPAWLLIGEGCMLNSQESPSEERDNCNVAQETVGKVSDNPLKGVPLIPIDAMAGVLKGEVVADERDCDRVLIPGIKADYVVTVRGNSMEPLYFSGDLVACQVLPLSDIFFQWGKAYVINTSSGVLLKKIKPGSNHSSVLLVSENTDYDPIEMPRSNIYHVALVTALVRLM